MYKLPNPPSPQAELHELADFVELQAWINGSVSAREALAALGRLDDNEFNEGCDDDADQTADLLDEVMNEVDRRNEACKGGYPFSLDLQGTVLRYSPEQAQGRDHIYHYLLLGTRLNMRDDRMHGGIDGAHLLEELFAHVLKRYLGHRAQSYVFGTSNPGNFPAKVNELCSKIGEGDCFRTLDSGPVEANDDKLDAVAWIPFSDRKACQLVIFGQCKSGTLWKTHLTQLQPVDFIKRWISTPYMLDPMRAFCVAEAANRAQWNGTTVYSGLFIDRCRIVDFAEEIDDALSTRIRAWNEAVRSSMIQ
jgi:hypothetical protein